MSGALQRRNEQLERWRQYEASIESQAQEYQFQAPNNQLLTTQQVKHSNDFIESPTKRSNNRTNDGTNTNSPKSKRRAKFDFDLQVKFSNDTLFLHACAIGDISECERLLREHSVDIDVTTCDGLSGLHEAAICGHVEMIKFLVSQGANVNCCDNEGWTPLHAASSLGQSETVAILLNLGADVTVINCDNMLAYDLARNDQVKSLIEKHMNNVDIDYLRSQEERAIERDIDKWIETGFYEERSHPVTNATVLHVIAAKGYVDLMKKVLKNPKLKNQINLEAKDNEGFTPLLAASFWNQSEIVDLLINHGANIFAQANNGYKISSIVSITALEESLIGIALEGVINLQLRVQLRRV